MLPFTVELKHTQWCSMSQLLLSAPRVPWISAYIGTGHHDTSQQQQEAKFAHCCFLSFCKVTGLVSAPFCKKKNKMRRPVTAALFLLLSLLVGGDWSCLCLSYNKDHSLLLSMFMQGDWSSLCSLLYFSARPLILLWDCFALCADYDLITVLI